MIYSMILGATKKCVLIFKDWKNFPNTTNFEISGNLMANGIELCNDVFWLILDVEKNLDLTSRALNYDIP